MDPGLFIVLSVANGTGAPSSAPGKRGPFMRCNMIRFTAFDLILGIFFCSMVRIAFVAEVFCMYFDDRSGNPSRFRVPADNIPYVKRCFHNRFLIGEQIFIRIENMPVLHPGRSRIRMRGSFPRGHDVQNRPALCFQIVGHQRTVTAPPHCFRTHISR